MRVKILVPLLILIIISCTLIRIRPVTESLPTEIDAAPPSAPAAQTEPTPQPSPPAAGDVSAAGQPAQPGDRLAWHGLMFAFVYPLLFFGVPWLILEIFVVRYVQPRGEDVADVRMKAQDGLFLEGTVSITARRTLTVASTRMTWPRVRNFVEKTIEQELIHAASQFPTLEDLERNIKAITDNFMTLPIVESLSQDFGLEVLWFNIEITYPQETMDALNRKAEASAGGTAYLAYAAAAHLDPDSPEARELYKVYQVTSGRVDAARNLGGGIASLTDHLTRRRQTRENDDETARNT